MAFVLAMLLFVAVVGLGYLGLQTLVQWRLATQAETERAALEGQYRQLRDKYTTDIKRCKEYIAALKVNNERLNKWKDVADADAKAAEMTAAARTLLEKANNEASQLTSSAQQRAVMAVSDAEQKAALLLSDASKNSAARLADAEQKAAAQVASATEEASKITSDAKQRVKTLTEEAEGALDSATRRAASIVEGASKKAEKIGGDAYEAMKDASLYERTAKAMKNVIGGYGDEYIVPPHSLLDGLGDAYQHVQAGRELKIARECTKVMIRNGSAAACDYAEATRRETAINFVIDAFNGKVDSILSRVKHDNAGKLTQEVRDAFALVNFGGKAFRNARITEEYLAARLDELKWGAITQQLASREREEQRFAKEQAREEARAQKERERALREAAKDEETLRRAIEQAREQFDQASGEQKAMYEQRLQDMAERLKEAEERKQHAISMAQQTKKGHVYVTSNIGSFGEDVYKIGLTRRWDPFERVRELGGASVPFGFDVHAMILSEDAPALEKQLHSHFALMQMNKVNPRKEFFRVSLKQIREEIEKLGVTGYQWTMTAEAREYRETVATEKKIGDDPRAREAWLNRQLEVGVLDDDLLEPVGAGAEDD